MIEEHNDAALDEVAARLLDVARTGRVVHAAAAGHSVAAVLETLYRAGGLACVRPLFHPGLLPLNGAQASIEAERVSGLAATLVAPAGVQPGDLAVVFSNSGVNAFPVEAAHELKERGAYVVAVSSRLHMAQAPARSFAELGDLADTVRDTAIPPGDAVVPHRAERPRRYPRSAPPICGTCCWPVWADSPQPSRSPSPSGTAPTSPTATRSTSGTSTTTGQRSRCCEPLKRPESSGSAGHRADHDPAAGHGVVHRDPARHRGRSGGRRVAPRPGDFRERTPRAVRSGWLGIVALGQVTITCWSLRNVFEQDPGPDIVFGVAVATAALGVAVACVVEACASGPSTPTVQG